MPASIPAEFDKAFDNILAQGDGKLVSGTREVLAWPGNFKAATKVATSIAQVEKSFTSSGWKFEPQGKYDDLQVFNLVSSSKPRRVVIGFFVPGDDVLVCALMEVLLPGEAPAKPVQAAGHTTEPFRTGARAVNVDSDTKWINVMGNDTPGMPDFPKLQPKAGRVRGYVKDWSGKPLAGAELGVRSSYLAGYYSGAQGKTDANGYYEFVVPKGSAHYYNAGYQIEWGDGVAAVSLHPADGSLDSFVTMDGAVENFVLLPYGITSRENLQQYQHLPSTFYGGAIAFGWYSVAADDNNAPPFAIRAGGTLEITLTPTGKMLDGSAGIPFLIKKKLGISGQFYVHNIPLGRYSVAVKLNGRPVKMKDNKKFDQLFGMTPVEATGEASILFTPDQAKASMMGPQHGAWKWIEIGLSAQ